MTTKKATKKTTKANRKKTSREIIASASERLVEQMTDDDLKTLLNNMVGVEIREVFRNLGYNMRHQIQEEVKDAMKKSITNLMKEPKMKADIQKMVEGRIRKLILEEVSQVIDD